MHDSLYIVVELGAGFAAIITFMFAFLGIVRRWVLKRICRDIELYLAKRDSSVGGLTYQARVQAERARYAAKQARYAAKQARRAAAVALDAAYQAKHAFQATGGQTRAAEYRRHDDTRSGPSPGKRQDGEDARG